MAAAWVVALLCVANSGSAVTGAAQVQVARVQKSPHYARDALYTPNTLAGFALTEPIRLLPRSEYAPFVRLLEAGRVHKPRQRRCAADALVGFRITDGGGRREMVLNRPCHQLFVALKPGHIQVVHLHEDAAMQVWNKLDAHPLSDTELLVSLVLRQKELDAYWHNKDGGERYPNLSVHAKSPVESFVHLSRRRNNGKGDRFVITKTDRSAERVTVRFRFRAEGLVGNAVFAVADGVYSREKFSVAEQ